MRYYFLGICGTAMASLAVLLKQKGHEVWGTDQNIYPPMSDFLKTNHIPLYEGYHPDHLKTAFDLAIVGNALSRGNSEIEELLNKRLPYASLPEVIRREFIQQFRTIVITGTHGKTSTTALISWLMDAAGLSPSFLIGGISRNFSASARTGKGKYFVIEGDEYDSAFFDKRPKFLHYFPQYLVINNIEFDHADIYENIDQIKDGFRKLLRTVPGNGLVLANGDDPRVRDVVAKNFSRLQLFGKEPACDWSFQKVRYLNEGMAFQVYHNQKFFQEFTIPQCGEFHLYNTLAAIALMVDLGMNTSVIQQGLTTFRGVQRRLDYWGQLHGALLYDDFAHHPTAIGHILQSLRKLHPDKRIVAIFEPRTNTSIRNIFQNELPGAFREAQVVIILPVHRASSIPPEQRLSLSRLQDDLQKGQKQVILLEHYPDLHPTLKTVLRSGDAAILLTNGNLGGEYERLRSEIRQASPTAE